MNTARLFILDKNGDPIEVKNFTTVTEAMAHAEALMGEKPEYWNDTQIGYEAMTRAEYAKLDETGEYPDRYFQITGIDPETNEDCEVFEDDE